MSLVLLVLKHDTVPVGFPVISCHIPSMTFHIHERHMGQILSKILVNQFAHILINDRICIISVSFSQLGFMNQWCSKAPQCLTNGATDKAFIWLKVSATIYILNYTPVYS